MDAERTEMNQTKFTRPKRLDGESTRNLYVANCGPAVGLSYDQIEFVFGQFGRVLGVHAADETGARVIVCFSEASSAEEAFRKLNGSPCTSLASRTLHIRYSEQQNPHKVRDSFPVCLSASELAIPGIYLVHDFVTAKQGEELLASVDSRPWKILSKRRVQHYGYEFLYETRNVDRRQYLGELPSFVAPLLDKISSFSDFKDNERKIMNQLTINEYPSGVGLSPHIDTHSAFDELICSLSLAGPCIMEFRKYVNGSLSAAAAISDMKEDNSCSKFTTRTIFLPPRSMLLMSGEGRYAWHHYIPHHKVDIVGEHTIRRSPRRVSFTFRKVLMEPCSCEYPQYCDSQKSAREVSSDKQ